jgi:hypothetical protein
MHKFSTFVVVAAVASSTWLVGCAGDPVGEDVTGNDTAAATSLKYYDCSTSEDLDQVKRLEVGINETTFELTDVSKDAAPPDKGRIDPSYRPTPAYEGAIRYSGFPKLVELWDEVGSVDLIVSKEVQNSRQGKIWMRTAGGSGGGTTPYFCKPKASKYTVDVDRRSRLLCDLKLVCTHDNPPGDTCLTEAFINQNRDDSSTLRTTYLDHFGVHARERRVNVGVSSSMDRSTRKWSGEWAGHKLDVTYRGGVTYVGTFTLPDGRSTEAQCNDLAMFD